MVRKKGQRRWLPTFLNGRREESDDEDDDKGDGISGHVILGRKGKKGEKKNRRKRDVDITNIPTFTGTGKKLSDAAAPLQAAGGQSGGGGDGATARQVAGEAALARIEQRQGLIKVHTSQDAFRKHMRKQLEAAVGAGAEAAGEKASAAAAAEKRSHQEVPVEEELALLSLYSTCLPTFTCPLTGATLTKGDRETRVREAIWKRFARDAVDGSVMMIHTFNGHKGDKVKDAVDIMDKYVDNVTKHPTEEKYRRIKVRNKVFQEKLHCVQGCREFLQALGFQSTTVRGVEGQEDDEEFLVLPEEQTTADALELMTQRMDRLRRGEPVRARLDRRPQAFRPSPNAASFDLPPEFYSLTAEELKREQQERSELADRITMLATKAMREKQAQRELRRYNYTVLRIKLPDGNLLQGTFYAWDRIPALFGFVRESLVAGGGGQPFRLIAPGGQKLQESEDVAFAQCNLVPAALLIFSWDAAARSNTAASTGVNSPALLKPDLLNSIRTL